MHPKDTKRKANRVEPDQFLHDCLPMPVGRKNLNRILVPEQWEEIFYLIFYFHHTFVSDVWYLYLQREQKKNHVSWEI